jgi:hypothetical protein
MRQGEKTVGNKPSFFSGAKAHSIFLNGTAKADALIPAAAEAQRHIAQLKKHYGFNQKHYGLNQKTLWL